MNHTAYLSNDGEYTFFTFGDRTISFLTSRNLEKYLEIVEWDHGYIVVLSKNYNREQEEDYLYYTKHCIVEAMHAHASDKRMTEGDLPSFLSELMAVPLCRKEGN